MKIQEHKNSLETNVENETQDFGIGDASVIIDILRNRLYEHKIQTMCQEYICNARDAMREIGKANEFEVTVPTRLNPVFKVRDFGPGITPDRMANVFVKYGASTKRNTDSQTGGFGIGAKSAWSYTDSFTIVTFIDGVKRSYVAHIGVNNQGRLDLVSTDTTDEANGTEIQVAVKNYDIDEFRSAIFRATYFWSQPPVFRGELNPPTLVRGEVISDLLEVIDPNMLPEYVRTYNTEEIIAVIDGIPYVMAGKLTTKIDGLNKLNEVCRKTPILHFGNGIVEVSASRESIADSKHTLAALEKIGHKATVEAQTHIANAFGKVTATPDYLRTYANMSGMFDVDKFAKYGDYTINSNRIANPLFTKIRMTVVHCMGKYGRGRVDKITRQEMGDIRKEFEIDKLPHLFFISKAENGVVQNKRIREYFKKHTHMILLEVLHTSVPKLDAAGKPVLELAADGKTSTAKYVPVSYPGEFQQVINELGAKDFSSVTYVDPPKVVKAKVTREDTEICLHGTKYGLRHIYTTLAENTQKWIYVRLKEGQWPHAYSYELSTELNEYTKDQEDAKICGLSARAIKMVQGNANFTPIEEYLKDFKPTKDLILATKGSVSKNGNSIRNMSGLKGIEDPVLVDMLAEYDAISKAKVRSIPEILANKVSALKEIREFKDADMELGKLMKKDYALVEEISQYSNLKKEIVFYANAKYREREGK